MARAKSYFFVIDNMDGPKALLLKWGLLELNSVVDVKYDTHSGLIEVVATRKIEDGVQNACQVAGLTLRTEVKRKHL